MFNEEVRYKQTAKRVSNLALKIVLLILVVPFVCIVTFAVLLLVDSNNPNSLFHVHPSDEKLISIFYEHNEKFEQLAQMLITEKEIEVIYPDTSKCQIANQKIVSSADSLSCANYIKMFQTLGLDWARAGNEKLWLTVSVSGLSVSGSYKGYYYSSVGIPSYAVLVEDTDEVEGQHVFHHIEENRYIFIVR